MERLHTGTIHRLESAAGTRIVVHEGMVWLTESDWPDDVFLAAGESHMVVGNGLELIEPLARRPGLEHVLPAAAVQIIPPDLAVPAPTQVERPAQRPGWQTQGPPTA